MQVSTGAGKGHAESDRGTISLGKDVMEGLGRDEDGKAIASCTAALSHGSDRRSLHAAMNQHPSLREVSLL